MRLVAWSINLRPFHDVVSCRLYFTIGLPNDFLSNFGLEIAKNAFPARFDFPNVALMQIITTFLKPKTSCLIFFLTTNRSR